MSKTFLKILLLTAVIFIAGFSAAHAATNTTLDFDGSSDYVVVGDNAVLDQANRLSLSVWIEPDDTPGGDEYILYRYNNYYLKINSSCKIVGGLNDATERITSAAAITCDGAAWTHIEMTYDKDAGGTDEIKLYINGVLDATADYSMAISASDKKLYIGAGDTAGDDTPENWFDGQIDSVQLYQYARSADNVRLDYNEGLATHLGPSGKTCSEDPASCMDYGLVGSWNMDEGTGTTIYDGSDEGNNGSLGGGTASKMPKWTTDSPSLQGGAGGGSSLSFDGVDDYVDCGNDESLNITDAITIEAWVYQTSSAGRQDIARKGYNRACFEFDVYVSDISLGYTYSNGDWECLISTSDIITLNTWHHVVGTIKGDVVSLYHNGILLVSQSVTGANLRDNGNTAACIGYDCNNAQYFNGTIDEVRIYNRALSAEEVRYHYNHGGPVASWNFDEGEGTVAYDETANNNDGTLGGGTAAYEPSWVEGKHGGALSFDGVDDYVNCGNDESLNITDAITIEAWVKTIDAVSDVGIVSRYTDWGSTHWELFRDGAHPAFRVNDESGNHSAITGTSDITDGNWYHIAGVRDPSTDKLYIYVNGKSDATSVVDNTGQTTPAINLLIGKRASTYFNGSIDEVRIYNYARTPEQILQDYNAGKGVYFK